MIPIGHDRQVTRRLPVITITLIALNFLIFIVQASVEPQQERALEQSLEKLIGYTTLHPAAKFSREAQDRLGRIPAWDLREVQQKLREEAERSEQEEGTAKPVIELPENESGLIQKEMDRRGAAFVQAYDQNWNLKFGFIPAAHKNSPLNYLSSIFMHGGWEHLIGNMLCLFVVGIAMEDTWGGLFYLLFYVLGGFVATFTYAYSAPDSKVVCVGASGAIAAMMGAFLVRHFKSRFKIFIFVAIIRVPAYLYLPLMIAYDLRNSFRAVTDEVGGVAFWAHLGGFLFGAIGCFVVYYSGFEKFLAPTQTTPARSFGTGNAVSEALTHLECGEVTEALRKIQQRLEAVPRDPAALRLLAQIYGQNGQRSAAIETYQRLIKVNLQEKNLEEGLLAYCALLESYPADQTPDPLPVREWNLICDYLWERGMWREAAGEYEKLARAYPRDWLTAQRLVQAANCREQLLEYEAARHLYKWAYDLAVTNPNLLMQIAEHLTQIENILKNKNAA